MPEIVEERGDGLDRIKKSAPAFVTPKVGSLKIHVDDEDEIDMTSVIFPSKDAFKIDSNDNKKL